MAAPTRQWGMVVDQSRCIGCWTCAVGCNLMHNAPQGFWWNRVLTAAPGETTGESGRESSASAEAAETGGTGGADEVVAPASDAIDVPHGVFPDVGLAYLPVACQHCDHAPCVKACPVGAAFQRADGAILVDYERCIGCRACIAACPYGDLVFNWGEAERPTDFTVGYGHEHRTDGRLVFTPERPRGVVEKCTLCAELLDEGEEPFCVQVCPAGARVFGDLADPASEVSKLVAGDRGTELLPDLGTEPRIHYLPKRQGQS